MATISDALATAIQHHQAGRLQSAEQIYRQILLADPNQAAAIHLLGVIALQVGKPEIAIEHIERAIRLQGNEAAFHNNLGEAYRVLHRIPEAVACYRRALALNPNLAEANNNLGNALKEQAKLDEAIACYRRAVELKPNFAEAHNNLGVALIDQGKSEEPLACYRRALELMPNYAEAHNNLGNILKEQGKLKEAIACYRRALELNPKFAKVHLNLGDALKESGDFQGAEDCYRAALERDSRFTLAHYKLAELLGGKLPEKDLAVQRQLLAEIEPTDAQRLFLHFGLAQVLEARGEYAEAAAQLDRANAVQLSEWRRRGQEYDPQEHAAFVNRLMAACGTDFFARLRGFGSESEVPVFVMGLPRSGTTLIEQILASHSRVFGAGELALVGDSMAALGGPGEDSIEGLCQLNGQSAQRLASRHLERLCALAPAAFRIVDKTLESYLHLGLLASLFPRAKFIHCRRDLRDVAVSCWMTHFQGLPWANDQQHIASRFREYQRIMEHWRKVLPVPLLEVDYEETVADLEGVARKLVAWCGLPWEPQCLEFHRTQRPVSTASAVQVRQPLYATSVGRWRHYEQALASWFAQLERVR